MPESFSFANKAIPAEVFPKYLSIRKIKSRSELIRVLIITTAISISPNKISFFIFLVISNCKISLTEDRISKSILAFSVKEISLTFLSKEM